MRTSTKVINGKRLDKESKLAYDVPKKRDWILEAIDVDYDLDVNDWFHEVLQRDEKGRPTKIARHIRVQGWVHEDWTKKARGQPQRDNA